MNIILTNHAKQRMIERGIKLEEVQEILNFPNYTVTKNNLVEAHKLINGKEIKVIYSKEGKFIKIITVILR